MCRYARLRCEVIELQEELKSLTESQREGGTAGLTLQVGSCRPISWLPTVQVSNLGRRFAACELVDKAGPEQGMGKEQEGAMEQLLSEIQGLGKRAGVGGVGDTSEGLYQVYLAGGGARPSIELAAVEARVVVLERALW